MSMSILVHFLCRNIFSSKKVNFHIFSPGKYRSGFFIGGPRVAGQFLLCFSSLPTVGPSKQHAITIMISTHFKNDNHTL